jgi:hypothetical protein
VVDDRTLPIPGLGGPDRVRRIATVVALAALLVVHLHRCIDLFRPAGELLSAEPLVTDDNSMHSYYSLVGSQLIARTGQANGYVPMEMGGHPKTPIYDAAIVPVERAMATFRFLPPFLVYKLFVLLSMAAIALSALFSLRLLGLCGPGWVLGWALLVFHYWWGQGLVFTMAGMNTWLLAASLSLLLLSAAARLVSRWSWPLAALAGALMCVAPYVHPIAAVPVLMAAGVLIAMRKGDRRRALLLVAGSGALSLALNAGWMWNTYAHRQLGTPLSEFLGGAETPWFLLEEALRDVAASTGLVKTINRAAVAIFDVWLVAAGIVGLIWLRRRADPRFVPLLVPFVVLGFLTYFSGAFPSLQNIQPWRLRFLFQVVASATAALLLAQALRERGPRRLIAAATGGFACLYFLAFSVRPDVPRLQVGFDPAQRAWVEAINATVDKRARILVEDGPGYRGMGVAALHLGTDAQWIGGPYRAAYITYHKVSFITGKLSGRPLADHGDPELAAFFRRYNVRWLLAWHPETKRILDGRPGLVRRLREVEGLAFFEVLAPADSFFEKGSGQLEVELDTLRIRGAVAEGGSIVLRYHHYDHLVVEGAEGLRRFEVPGDPVGFIEVVGPGPEVTIRSRHGLGR